MKKFLFAVFLLLLSALAACGGKSDEIQPPEIVYGQDVCEECGMIIGDAKFAAATIDTKGRAHKFDDIGGMVLYHMDHPEFQVRAYFAHDYETQAWLRAETAFFVESDAIHGPMGKGIAAFTKRDTAEQLAARVNSKVLSFDELRVSQHMMAHAMP